MAITGSGTAEDPYVVTSYSEIKSILDVAGTSGHYSNPHMLLANDINCNDYGAGFVWDTLQSANTNYPFDLDLDGHTIQNIEVPNNKYFAYGNGSNLVHDGKILNVYLNGALAFSDGTSYRNVSISVDATGANTGDSSAVIKGNSTQINQCAIYVKGSKRPIIHQGTYSSGTALVNESDILIDSAGIDCTGIRDSGNWITFLGCRFVNSRIRGRLGSFRGSAFFLGPLESCVVNLEFTLNADNSFSRDSPTNTVVNSEIISLPSGSTLLNPYIKCTSSEICDGDALRSKGFVVVDVVGD